MLYGAEPSGPLLANVKAPECEHPCSRIKLRHQIQTSGFWHFWGGRWSCCSQPGSYGARLCLTTPFRFLRLLPELNEMSSNVTAIYVLSMRKPQYVAQDVKQMRLPVITQSFNLDAKYAVNNAINKVGWGK